MERWHDNRGKLPRWPGATLIWIIYTGGHEARTPHRIDGLRWSITGAPFDISRFRRA